MALLLSPCLAKCSWRRQRIQLACFTLNVPASQDMAMEVGWLKDKTLLVNCSATIFHAEQQSKPAIIKLKVDDNVQSQHTLREHSRKNLASNGHCPTENSNEIIAQLGPETDVATYASLLRRCTIEKALAEGERVHQHMIRCGFSDHTFSNNLLVQMYGKCGSLQHARTVFDNMIDRNLYSWTIMLAACAQNGSLDDARAVFAHMPERDGISWNAMITACAQNGQSKEALQLFGQMHAQGFEPDKITFVCVLDACAKVGTLEEGREIHASVICNGCELNVVVGTTLVNMYGKCGSLDDARAVFVEMPQQDVVSWSAMIAACTENGHSKEALQFFGQMQAKGCEPNKVTFISVLDACASIATLEDGQEIHSSIVKHGWQTDVVVATAIINLYGKCRCLDDARAVFSEMPPRDVILWNAMIVACAHNDHGKEALQVFGQMQAHGYEPSKVTFVCILDACVSVAALEEGREVHARIAANGWESDVVIGTALINMYGKCGGLDDAMDVFLELPQRDVISWNTVMTACAENGHGKEALQLFDKMQAESTKPNAVTFICVLTACSHMGLVADGRRYFTSMSQDYGISPSVDHYECLIDLLGRAGQLDKAEQMINSMPLESVASAWLSLLSSCRLHGDVERGRRAANHVIKIDENNASSYVLLANMCAAEQGR